jgi:hypothetical protein
MIEKRAGAKLGVMRAKKIIVADERVKNVSTT